MRPQKKPRRFSQGLSSVAPLGWRAPLPGEQQRIITTAEEMIGSGLRRKRAPASGCERARLDGGRRLLMGSQTAPVRMVRSQEKAQARGGR
jgi:hypothetical protein